MRATFIGDPNDDYSGPKVLNLYGIDFPKDVSVPLAGLDASQIAKLSHNNHFEVAADDGAFEAPPPPADPPAGTVDIPVDWMDLKWPQLRSLAAKVTKDPVGNKEAALEAIAAEVGRRGSSTKKLAPEVDDKARADAEFQAWAEGDD